MYSLTTTAKKLLFRKSSLVAVSCNKRIIAKKLFAASNILQQGLGLMCRQLLPGEALLFFMSRKQRFSLHMWFVFHPIDVLFCDVSQTGLRIIEIKRSFKPFSLYKAKKPATLFVELPIGAAKHLRPGDELRFSRKIFKRG